MIFNLLISATVIKKLNDKHGVTREEVEECFYNRTKGLLEDTREVNKTKPPTMWFIAETNDGRLLKVVFIELSNRKYEVKTCYEPNTNEVKIYGKFA